MRNNCKKTECGCSEPFSYHLKCRLDEEQLQENRVWIFRLNPSLTICSVDLVRNNCNTALQKEMAAKNILPFFSETCCLFAKDGRNVVEHTVIFQFKPNVTDKVKQDIVDGLWSLDEQCREQVQATSLGYILHPEQAEGAAIGLYMRFFSKEALHEYLDGGPKAKVVDIMIPHMTGEITVDFESQIEDNENSVYRKGKAFAGGIERIVYIKVKERTSQDAIDEMVKALNDLNFAPELSSLLVQITAGANFCEVDDRYTHAFVARCPSVEAVQSFSSHPYYIDVFSKKVLPILEASLTADYVVDRVRHLTALL